MPDRDLTPDEINRLRAGGPRPADRDLTPQEYDRLKTTGSPGPVMEAAPPDWLAASPAGGALFGGIAGLALAGPPGGLVGAIAGGMGGRAGERLARSQAGLPPPAPRVLARVGAPLRESIGGGGEGPLNTALDVASAGVTEGVLPELIGGAPFWAARKAVGPITRAMARPENAEVIHTNQEFGLGLSLPEQISPASRATLGRVMVTEADRTMGGRYVAERARNLGDQRVRGWLSSRLDQIGGRAPSTAELGLEVQGTAAERLAQQQARHGGEEAISASAHKYLQEEARAAHQVTQQQRKLTFTQEQARLRQAHEGAQDLFEAQDRTQKQGALNTALAQRKAAGDALETLQKTKGDTAVSIAELKAKAADIIEREYTPQARAFSRSADGAEKSTAQQMVENMEAQLANARTPEAQATLRKNLETLKALPGMERVGELPLEEAVQRASGAVRAKLEEVLNADDVVTFAEALQWRQELTPLTQYLKTMKDKKAGQMTALNQEISSALEKAVPEWGVANTGYRTASDALRAADKANKLKYSRKAFTPGTFKEEAFVETPYKGTKFVGDPTIKKLIKADPSQAVGVIGNDPARVYAVRDTLTDGGKDLQGAAVWDKVRRHWVEQEIVGNDLPGMADRLKAIDPETLKAYVGDAPAFVEDLGKLSRALGRMKEIPPNRLREQLVVGLGLASAWMNPVGTAKIVIGYETLPAVVSWAARSPRMTEALVEGLKLTRTAASTKALARVLQGYVEATTQEEQSEGGPPAPSVPARAQGAAPGTSGPPPRPAAAY